ncbi:fungal-specific transcription factor domain-containing protein, partial [Kalaharituber pfeilii]
MNLNSQGHALSNILSPSSSPLTASTVDTAVLQSSRRENDHIPPVPTAPLLLSNPAFVNRSMNFGDSNSTRNLPPTSGLLLADSSTATSTSTSSPVAGPTSTATSARGGRGGHRAGFKGNKRATASSGSGSAEIGAPVTNKRRCVSNACIACRKRKSKCDGNAPSCAACSSVYGTECIYDPTSDHRRKGVYKRDIDNLKTRNTTLQTLVQAILDYPEDQVIGLVHAIRNAENLEDVAEAVSHGGKYGLQFNSTGSGAPGNKGGPLTLSMASDHEPTFESELSHRMSQLRVDSESGQVRFIGGTSNLILLPSRSKDSDSSRRNSPGAMFGLDRQLGDPYLTDSGRNPLLSWTNVLGESLQACEAIEHLLNMYFTWHYPYFTTLSRELFLRDFRAGYSTPIIQPKYCTPLLFNAMLALGCHFTAHPMARAVKSDPDTAGDHFFNECKRLILENDEHVTPRLTTVQALALMSVREAGCAREERGWSYSGMSFRMGIEMGLNLDLEGGDSEVDGSRQRIGTGKGRISEEELDARKITFWGCFLFDKCWSNYMGRMPQLPSSIASVQKYMIMPFEDSAEWYPYTDVGKSLISAQPARTRVVALQILELCEISSDILIQFYNPNPPKKAANLAASSLRAGTSGGMGKADIRNLSNLWSRLEEWRKNLPRELEPQQGCLPQLLLMHMFHQLLYIHLFRPFLKYTAATLPALSNLDPKKTCVEAASKISKFLRFYKREYGLRQICNIAAYMIHSACTIHLMNVPEKSAKRDIVQGLRSLEDMAEGWLCARRALVIIRILAKKWKIELPDEAVVILARAAKGRAEQFGL